jgi:hypothetical protein
MLVFKSNKPVSFLLIVLFFACNNKQIPSDVKKTIKLSGNNKMELVNTITHYKDNPADSLKLKAAYFLISNMVGLVSLNEESVKENEFYFDLLDSVRMKQPVNKKLSSALIASTLDDVLKTTPRFNNSTNPTYTPDLLKVTSKFLIENIDNAFLVWEQMPWAKNINFHDFCEYILPYRSTDTYSDTARAFIMKKYYWVTDSVKDNCFDAKTQIDRDMKSWYFESTDLYNSKYAFLNPKTLDNVLKVKVGDCFETNSLKILLFRSIGIPTSLNIVSWGNHPALHANSKIMFPEQDTIQSLITNANEPRDVVHILPGVNMWDWAVFDYLPENVDIQYLRTIAKIWRKSYSVQPSSLPFFENNVDNIPSMFRDIHLTDATNEYVVGADVELNLSNPKSNNIAYLAVFTIYGWKPVSWSKIKKGTCSFKDMGRNIAYLPVYYRNNKIIPAGNPFILQMNGAVKEIVKQQGIQTLTLHRKYPFYVNGAMYSGFMRNYKFRGANKADLSDAQTLYEISSSPYYMTEVMVDNPKKFRYLFYDFRQSFEEFCAVNPEKLWVKQKYWAQTTRTYCAEMEFWSTEKGKTYQLSGTAIGDPGVYKHGYKEACDGDRNTYFQKTYKGPGYMGIDLGVNNEKQVTKIRFCPRNDTNDIKAGDNYELFYWDNNTWVSLGTQKGIDMKPLIFKKIPIGTLFWLRDLTEGKEERIFTYENGKQVWW